MTLALAVFGQEPILVTACADGDLGQVGAVGGHACFQLHAVTLAVDHHLQGLGRRFPFMEVVDVEGGARRALAPMDACHESRQGDDALSRVAKVPVAVPTGAARGETKTRLALICVCVQKNAAVALVAGAFRDPAGHRTPAVAVATSAHFTTGAESEIPATDPGVGARTAADGAVEVFGSSLAAAGGGAVAAGRVNV